MVGSGSLHAEKNLLTSGWRSTLKEPTSPTFWNLHIIQTSEKSTFTSSRLNIDVVSLKQRLQRKTFWASTKQKPAKEGTFIFYKPGLISIDRKPNRISSNQITLRLKKQDQEAQKNQIRRKKMGKS